MRDAELTDFEIGAVLGQGGMATVHRAIYRPTGEEVALKLILGNVENDPTFMERFRREVKATIGLDHPNICRVIGAGEGDGRLFMAMEIIDGGSVRELKQKLGGRMPLQLAVELAAQLLAALGAAHARGVIHRDLKPANLMLTKSGLLKLVDFGIAKSSSDATLTATGMLVGTPAYMSPEQVRGDELDGRSDLFSTGLILHDLLCGRSPYYSDNPGTSLMKVLQEDVPGIFDVLFGVDPFVEAFHGKATAKDRDQRYRTADEALAALQPYLKPVRARYPNLVADCLRDPAGMKQRLLREHAEAEVARAQALVQRHGPIHAAALALENAVHIDPSYTAAHDKLAEVSEALGFHTEVFGDPRIAEAEEALRKQPQHPGLIKRLADLHRAAGNMRESARYLKRYLRQKDDSATVQQLLALLWGPGSDPALVTGTINKLSTQDIMAGLKTGGMPALKPEKPLKERAAANLTGTQKAAIAEAAQRRATVTGTSAQPAPATGGFQTTSDEARHIASLSDDGIFEQLRERFGAFFWLGVAGVVVVVMVVVGAKLSSALVSTAQKDMKKHAEGEVLREEDTMFNLQTTKLNEAKDALKRGSFVACANAAHMALEGEKTAKFVLDAKWLIAQCSLLAGDTMAARDALQDFKDNANIRDKRFELANTQLKAIERGEKPGGIREW
jgi:thioredoxin-like negative regulator of GroEL